MPYHTTPPKEDDASLHRFFYLCQTKGCGATINEQYVSLKTPSPKWCKTCIDKDLRHEIEKEYDLVANENNTQV